MKNLFSNFVERQDRARLEKLGSGVGNYISLALRFGYFLSFVLGGRRHSRFFLAVTHYGLFLRKWRGGPYSLVRYLKAAHVTLMQIVADGPVAECRDLGGIHRRAKGAIPSIIPTYHRMAIKRGDLTVTRFWLSLLGLYRIIDVKGKASFKSIIEPGVGSIHRVNVTLQELLGQINNTQVSCGIGHRVLSSIDLRSELKFRPRALLTSGANVPGGVGGFWALAWDALKIWNVRETPFGGAVRAFAMLTGQLDLLGLIELAATTAKHDFRDPKVVQALRIGSKRDRITGVQKGFSTLFGKMLKRGETGGKSTQWRTAPLANFLKNLTLGRLHVIPEPAGKMRIVAMGTWWVQCILYPLHRILYKRLGEIPQDGTWQQEKPIRALAAKILKDYESTNRWPSVYSFDLSAATDRFPVWYQVEILTFLTNRRFAETWRDLLVLPRYYTRGITIIPRGDALSYRAGQPMGLYSSWAMFSLSHHILVQQAAANAGYKGWYPWYALLGDDVVILGKDVAMAYKDLCDLLHVKIGMHKSLISSNGSFEFAKRFYVSGVDCSPISIREYWVALGSLPAFSELIARVKRYIPSLRLADVVRGYKMGYHSVAKLTQCMVKLGNSRLANLLTILMLPGGPFEREFESLFSSTSTAVRPNTNLVDTPITERRVKSVSRTIGQSLVSVSARASQYLTSMETYEYNLRAFDPLGLLREVLKSRMVVTLTNNSYVGLLERFGRYLLDGKLNSRGLITLLGRVIPIWKFSTRDVASLPDPFSLDALGGIVKKPLASRILKLRVKVLGLAWKNRPKGGTSKHSKRSKGAMGRLVTKPRSNLRSRAKL